MPRVSRRAPTRRPRVGVSQRASASSRGPAAFISLLSPVENPLQYVSTGCSQQLCPRRRDRVAVRRHEKLPPSDSPCRTPFIYLETSVNRKPNKRTRRIVISWTVGVKRAVSSAPAGPRFERLPTLGEVACAASNPRWRRAQQGAWPQAVNRHRHRPRDRPAGGAGYLHRPRTAPAAAAPRRPRLVVRLGKDCRTSERPYPRKRKHRVTADSWCGRECSIGQCISERLAAGHDPTASEPTRTASAPAAFLPPSYLPDPRRSRPRRTPKLPDPPPGRRHPEHSRRMLSASRHPPTTALPDSASEEYCTAAVPVMTPAVSVGAHSRFPGAVQCVGKDGL